MRNHKTITRGVLALVVLGVATAALVVSPVGAATTVTKKKAKNIAAKQVNKLAPGIATDVVTDTAVLLNTAQSASNTTETDLGPSYVDLLTVKVTSTGGRIMANANVSLRDTTAGVNQVECFLRLVNATGGVTELDHWVGTLEDGTGADRPIYPLVGAANPAAGVYDILVRCGEAAALTGVKFDSGHLIAWTG